MEVTASRYGGLLRIYRTKVADNIDTVGEPPANVAATAEPFNVKKLARYGTQHKASYLEYLLKITVVCDVTP
jgi:hypothetical protein